MTRAERLIQAREAAGFTSAAHFARTHGLSEATYRAYESGTRGLKPAVAERLAGLLNVSASWLLLGTDKDGAPPPAPPKRQVDGARRTILSARFPNGAEVEVIANQPMDEELLRRLSALLDGQALALSE